ncbi:hypothetical protein [Flavobacterium sp. ENC]|uniref:hypothetical protein n=1 Tax=Flavobacterium sp. ENC TaxID=2897330 RepID=UPI001E3DC677|nr:hypothetical protein [Flavobacterium sp. ENC]MCD0467250.1 hypothetical protein [Flavobacterium sp. ENC]
MKNIHPFSSEDFQKSPFHRQQNDVYADKPGNENSGGEGSTEGTAKQPDNL